MESATKPELITVACPWDREDARPLSDVRIMVTTLERYSATTVKMKANGDDLLDAVKTKEFELVQKVMNVGAHDVFIRATNVTSVDGTTQERGKALFYDANDALIGELRIG